MFDQTSSKEIATLEDPSLDFPQQILFRSDASKIITINGKSGIRVWDLPLLRRQHQVMGLDWWASCMRCRCVKRSKRGVG